LRIKHLAFWISITPICHYAGFYAGSSGSKSVSNNDSTCDRRAQPPNFNSLGGHGSFWSREPVATELVHPDRTDASGRLSLRAT
jgi:hypothetical protein